MERFLIAGAIALFALPVHAEQEWWQKRDDCWLTSNPKIVYCKPPPGADMNAPANTDLHPRVRSGGIGMFTGHRVRQRTLEEFLTRNQMREIIEQPR